MNERKRVLDEERGIAGRKEAGRREEERGKKRGRGEGKGRRGGRGRGRGKGKDGEARWE